MERKKKDKEEEELRVRRYDKSPSLAEFAIVEEANVPAVFEGCVRIWPAYRLWDSSKGGLERLKHLAGHVTVQVMATTSGSNFYGDIRGHHRVPISFQSFLDLAGRSAIPTLESELEEDVQMYLAQAGIYSRESGASSPLSGLIEDISTPSFLQSSSPVSAINLWMSVNGSRSSTHYDPFHNLLCVVSGSKEVKLWPPSAAPALYPNPISGEASNHSGVDFANPDLAKYPRFRSAMESFQTVTLRAGDAMFLPEGWYHQVDSEGVTVAVNLWWPSNVSLKLGSHMDTYLLRRLLANLIDSEKEHIVASVISADGHVTDVQEEVPSDMPEPKYGSTSLTNAETQALRTLILCVSDMMMVSTSGNEDGASQGPDVIARVFASLDPPSLQRTLLVMSVDYPRTLEALVLHKLSPLSSEILTRKFEEMDAVEPELDCPQEEFYAQIYSVFDDPVLAMAALVDGKESLAAMALQRVLDENLGLSCTLPP